MNNITISIIEPLNPIFQSIVALNISIALYYQTKQSVLLYDLTFDGRNDIEFFLNTNESKTLKELLSILPKVDEKLIHGYLVQQECGITTISGVGKIQDIDLLEPEEIKRAILLLKNIYNWNVFNIGRDFGERFLKILDLSNIVLIVIRPEELYLKYLEKIIDFLKNKHFPVQILKIVLVDHNKNNDNILEINLENLLKMKIFSKIICNNITQASFSKDEISLIKYPHSNFSISIKELSNKIIEFSKSVKNKTTEKIILKDSLQKDTEEKIKNLRIKIHSRVINEIEKEKFDINSLRDNQQIYNSVKKKIQDIVVEECKDIYSWQQRNQLVKELLDIILGFGPLEDFLKDPAISEIMVNGKDKIYIEKNGKIFLTEKKFDTELQLRTVIDRILSSVGRRVDESTPFVDARLNDGSRVNVIIPPVSLSGQCITIRKFTVKKLKISDLVSLGSLTEKMADFLKLCVKLKKNIIIVGGTGSGKTTLLNMLSSFIPEGERIITIEDSAELDLAQEHVVRLEARPPSIEGTGEITIRNLVINALRMRPDRIIIGECRGPEALDMLQAMNTGHEGSLTTIHANSPKDAILRLTTMVLMAGTELSEKVIIDQILSAINIIVYVSRLSDGTRKILSISELIKDKDSNEIKIGEIFVYQQKGISPDGKIISEFRMTNFIPSFYDEIEKNGLKWEILN